MALMIAPTLLLYLILAAHPAYAANGSPKSRATEEAVVLGIIETSVENAARTL